ncbi:hypothetical protein [Actinokineospora fastidiosa]|uniref:Uncharacterized protein n=1 Tax=Actinokineospora fastidiosa TaxID=1816 RepID=A0A918GK13_9PSEU|nr:hypothetical protein [Actinokineospora fastidiosa]GGS38250.1 hypothetical protein GCM10010171_36450 [Actinokineospora fastidiosa]
MATERWSTRPHTVVLPRPTTPRATLIARGSLLGLVGLAAAIRVAALDGPAQLGEIGHVFQVHTLRSLDTVPSGASTLALLQLAVYTTATGAFGRHDTGLAAVREPMVLAAVAVGVGIWWMARRMGLSRWTAGAAVGLVAVSPLAVAAQLGVRPENLAAAWAVAALVLFWTPHRHRTLAPDLWATAFLVIAVLTAPVAMALVPTAAWLMWRRRRRRLSLMVGSLFALGVGIGWPSTSLRPTPGPDWLALDPVLAAAGVFAAVAALFSFRLRPLAVGVLGLMAVGAAVLAVPFAAILLAGTIERGLTHQARTGRHTLVHPYRTPTAALAGTVLLAAMGVWVL